MVDGGCVCVFVLFGGGGGVVCVVLFVCYGCTFMCVCVGTCFVVWILEWGGGGGGKEEDKGCKEFCVFMLCTCVSCTGH